MVQTNLSSWSHHLVTPPLSLLTIRSVVSDLQALQLLLKDVRKPPLIPFLLWIPPVIKLWLEAAIL